jgi:putative copper export protein
MTSGVLVAALAVRWMTVLSTAALVGGLGLAVFVLPLAAPELDVERTRLRRWTRVWLAILILAAVGEMILRAQTMAGGTLSAALAALPLVLTRTHFGTLWIARLMALCVAFAASYGRNSTGSIVSLVAATAVALTSSLTGHAADWGDLSLSVAADWLHVMASALWTGGLLGLGFVLVGARRAWSAAVVGAVARRFSAMAGVCVVLIIGSGVYATWVEVPALAALWMTAYGRWLMAKVVLVLVIVGLGAVNRYRVVPHLDTDTARTRLFTLMRREAALAVIVFACTAALTESTPARHAYHSHGGPAGTQTMHDHVSPGAPSP